MTRPLTTAVFLGADRHLPPGAVLGSVQALSDSGVVDHMAFTGQLGNFVPPQLWTGENTPMAQLLGDPDSLDDAFLLAAFCRGSQPTLGTSVCVDAVRMGPGHLTQLLWTLTHLTDGDSILFVGAGEMKNCNPFGVPRKEGLKRLHDTLRALKTFWETDGPITFGGKVWHLDRAFLGGAKPHPPKVFAMGGGPKLMDYATSYADGFMTVVPNHWSTPDHAADVIAKLKQDVERKGRDPETFDIGITAPVLLHEDTDVIDRALDNPIVRWIAGIFGRINGHEWSAAGLNSPIPENWNYHMHYYPQNTDDDFIDQVLAKTTRDHSQAGYLTGTPRDIAIRLKDYVDAGVTYVGLSDFLPMVLDPADAAGTTRRSIDCISVLKYSVEQR